jgi:uncharacterized protein YfaS (alpha-2-macroglobulin family)
MPKRQLWKLRVAGASLFGCAFAALGGGHVGAARPEGRADLGGADRYLTAISTDKPIYRTGETVWVRGVVLHASKRTRLREAASAFIEIKGPKGETVASGQAATDDSVWAFSWPVPEGEAGGEHTIRVTYPWNGHAPAERKFDVRAFRAPRLKSQIVFVRDGYGPGDEVTATLEVTRAEGGAPAGAKVTATARVDGAEVARVSSSVSAKGLCTVKFALPRSIARGEGALSFAVEDGGVVETAAKTIPILLQTLDLALYPEGGELVAGFANRVYFEARTPAGKPADLAGVVVDERGLVAARFRSQHEGRGRIDLVPVPGSRYTLRVEEPAGIKTTWPLPAPASGAAGVVLRAANELTPAGAPVRLLVGAARPQKLKVTLAQREVELGSVVVTPARGELVELSLPARDADGVLTATVSAEDGTPLAERLVYRAPANDLKLEVRADKKTYVPGDRVTLTVKATREGKPVAATVGLTVTDDAVLEMIERREQAPSLPAMMLLEPEVRELADAHVYLDAHNPKAPLALDLLLGTQGWRRFVYMDTAKAIEKYGDQARRAVAFRAAPEVQQALERDDVLMLRVAKGAIAIAAAAPPMPMPAPAEAPPPRRAPPVFHDRPAPAMARPAAPPPVVVANAEPPASHVFARKKEIADNALEGLFDDKAVVGRRERRSLRVASGGGTGLVLVREYAHAARPERQAGDRVDFTETLLWKAAVRTDARTGEVSASFALADGVTTFKASASAFDGEGALGAATSAIQSVRPFYVEPKLPLEVTAGDTIALPVSLVNGTAAPLPGAAVKVSASRELRVSSLPPLVLAPGERARQLLEIGVERGEGRATLTLAGTAGPYGDTVARTLAIKPNGFPFESAFGGLTVRDGAVKHHVTIPRGVVPGTVRTSVAVYPTPLANMTQALARLIQDPNGCFEQTSSTTYPLTMAEQYFTSHTGVDPQLVAAAQEKLDAGYKRLVSFECSDKGYEWFGENPGHEALTAYGLLHFTDMAKVREVDQKMIARSRQWLLAQRDGKGGFARKRRALHSWVEDRDASNGYILWALLESGGRRADVEKELGAFEAAAAASHNSYVTALGANVLALAGARAEAQALMRALAERQGGKGVVEGATTSIVGSGGEALAIETTALAVLAWLREPAFAASVERSMKFLAASCQDGRYGSTQSTVLALRAINAYDQSRARPKAPGSVRLWVDGKPVGAAVAFDRDTQGALKLPEIAGGLPVGPHELEVRMEGGAPMPYSISVAWNALTPDSAKESKVGLEVALAKTTITEGELVEANATITNRTSAPIPTPVAIIGLPGGLEPRHDQLKELVKRGTIDAYEVLGREVVLYWRALGAGQKVLVPLSLVAAVPGRYTGPASRAYLYYTDEHKTWTPGLAATIAPRRG